MTRASKIGVETRYTSWGAGMVDLDNDGNPDVLFVTRRAFIPKWSGSFLNTLTRRRESCFATWATATFEEIETAGEGITTPHSSRGCAFGDFDNDGDIDVLIVNMNEPPSLLRNDLKPGQNWLKVKLEGVKSNRSAIGARVMVHYGTKVQAQAVLSQSSYYSCNDPRLHFGLGACSGGDCRRFLAQWTKEQYSKVAANQLGDHSRGGRNRARTRAGSAEAGGSGRVLVEINS